MNSYAQTQSARDRDHEAQYDKWVESQPLEKRRELKRLGLGEVPRDFKTFRGRDASDREDLADEPVFSPHQDTPTASALRVFVAEMHASKNKALTCECFSVATSLLYEGDSESEIARRHKISRAAVSKIIKGFQAMLGLAPTGPMRRLTVCKKYASRAAIVHIRHDRPFR